MRHLAPSEAQAWPGLGGRNSSRRTGIALHDPGLFDEYKEIWIDTAPSGDEILSMK
jgi:hypothetical protein